MAAKFEWSERNGTAPGTRTDARTECNFKDIDDSTTNYAAAPIQAPTVGSSYSFEKWIQGHFEGSALTPSTDGNTGDEYTDFIVLQLQVGTAAPSGDIGVQTFTCKYNES